MPTIKFTRDNARAMQAKGQAVKLARVAKLRETIENLRETIAEEPQDFRYSMLLSVRAQIKIILTKMDRELDKPYVDTKSMKELAETLAKMEAMEQKLSMRAGPGSLKPSNKPSPRRSAPVEDPLPVETWPSMPIASAQPSQMPQDAPDAQSAPVTLPAAEAPAPPAPDASADPGCELPPLMLPG